MPGYTGKFRQRGSDLFQPSEKLDNSSPHTLLLKREVKEKPPRRELLVAFWSLLPRICWEGEKLSFERSRRMSCHEKTRKHSGYVLGGTLAGVHRVSHWFEHGGKSPLDNRWNSD